MAESGVADTLTELALCSNQISNLTTLTTLTDLKKLMLSDNAIDQDAENLDTLAGLDFSMLTNLEYVDLSYNNIVYLPRAEKFPMTQLKELHLNNNRLSLIKTLTSNCNETEETPCPLEYLYLQSNQIGGHISFLANMRNLKKLNISHNNAYSDDNPIVVNTSTMNNFSDFTQLEELDISNRNWTQTDNDNSFIVPSISSLKVLNLSNTIINCNPMQSLEGIQAFEALEHLNVSNNNIESVDSISGLPLKIINLANNNIESVDSISGLPLKIINLANNSVTMLPDPDSIGTYWSNLETLDLENNPLVSIDPIGKFSQIKALNLCCATSNLENLISKLHDLNLLSTLLISNELLTESDDFNDLHNNLPFCEFYICYKPCDNEQTDCDNIQQTDLVGIK